MRCELVLEALLDAEPAELSATTQTPLAEHLRGCARCHRVATQLLQDTWRLAPAMAAQRVRRPARRVRQVVLLPTFAVAALVVAVMLRGHGGAGIETAPVAVSVPIHQEPVVSAVAEPSTLNGPVVRLTRPVRTRTAAFAPATPIVPVRLSQAPVAAPVTGAAGAGVTVTPPAGTRAAVMHTSNPRLVVVWLY